MNITKYAVAAVVAASMATPAYADKVFAVTPSGAAEMLFPDKPAVVVGKLSSRCIDVKWSVVSSSSNEVVCEAPLNMGQSILGQMLLGNSYSTPPRRFFRFNIAEVSGISRVQASGWMELQMAFGQNKRTDFAGAEFQNSIMVFMGGAGGKYPAGTTFPNHALLGFDEKIITSGKYRLPQVAAVRPGMAAEKAGLLPGDILTRIAGKRLKSEDDYLDAFAKAAETPTYQVEILRSGKPMTLTLDRAFRPASTEQVVATADPAVTSHGQTAIAPTSVADELAKLAKLKTDGVLTDAEFEAQKKKLLGQ